MRLPSIFERKAASVSKSSTLVEEESSDTTATAYHVEDMMARANVGIKRAGQSGVRIKNVDLSMKKRGIKAAAMGFQSNSEDESIQRKADEGWKRAMNVSGSGIKEVSKAQPRHRSYLKSAVIGIAQKEKKDEDTLDQQMDQRGEEALRRAKQVKDQMGPSEAYTSSSKPKVRQNILSASMGITSLKDPTSDSNSDDSLYTEDLKSKMEEGMNRVKNMKPVPGYESHRPQKQRGNILAASMGITSVKDSVEGSASEDSLYTDDLKSKIEEGLNRVKNMKPVPGHETHRPQKQRSNILAASMGIKPLEDPRSDVNSEESLYAEEMQSKIEEGMNRVKNMKPVPGHEIHRFQKQRNNILAASMGINTTRTSDDSIQEEYERKMEEGYKRAMDPKTRVFSDDEPTETSSKNVKTRTTVLAAAMGVTHIDDPNDPLRNDPSDQERMHEADEKAEDGLRRLEQIRNAPVNSRIPKKKPAVASFEETKHKRGKILTAAINKYK